MHIFVLRCGDGPVPLALASHTATTVPPIPTAGDLEDLLHAIDDEKQPRLIVLGDDSALAAVLTVLMRTERLQVEVGYVPCDPSPSARIYSTGTGAQAANNALNGSAVEMPLIRDDLGIVLVGGATITGPPGEKLEGEAYVDDTKLFTGSIESIALEPTAAMPGLRAHVRRRTVLTRRRWVAGRAMQLGARTAVLVRDGVPSAHSQTRSAFYRHHEPWLLVR